MALEGPHSWVVAEGLGEGAAEPKELAAKIRSHAATTAEIRTLCKDLQVRGWGTQGACMRGVTWMHPAADMLHTCMHQTRSRQEGRSHTFMPAMWTTRTWPLHPRPVITCTAGGVWLCAQVLGRSEFKQLLRWRLALRKDLKADLATEEEAAKVGREGWEAAGQAGCGEGEVEVRENGEGHSHGW